METKLFKKTGTKESDIAQLLKGNVMLYKKGKDYAILVQFDKANQLFIAARHEAVAEPKHKEDEYIVKTYVYRGQHYMESPIEGISISDSIIDVLKDAKELEKE
jgi:hypothetical protein